VRVSSCFETVFQQPANGPAAQPPPTPLVELAGEALVGGRRLTQPIGTSGRMDLTDDRGRITRLDSRTLVGSI
jgi:hypothetical protein